MQNRWAVEVLLEEDGVRTAATARLTGPNAPTLVDHGTARCHPHDKPVSRIGEEIAVARALVNLAQELLDKASADIESSTHEHAHLRAHITA
jgi:hypothetical protein